MSSNSQRMITGEDNIIPIDRHRRSSAISVATQGFLDSKESIPSQTHSASELTPAPSGIIDDEILPRAYRQSDADLAFSCISAAADLNNDDVDRTNGFDEWKDHLQSIAKRTEGISPEQRQIVGMLLAATSSSEISSFNIQSLFSLRDVTSLLRKSRVAELDAKYAIRILKKSGLNVFSKVDYEFTEEKAIEAEQIISKLLAMK